MSNFKRRMSKDSLKWIITFSLLIILSVGMIFAFTKINDNATSKTLGSNVFTYSIGLIDEEGEYKQGTSAIYTKDFYSVEGLECDIEEKASITYKIFFYDEDEKFLSSTDELSADYDGTAIPETAESFKVMITPTDDAEVSFFEIGTYAKQLTVTISK